MQSTFYKGNKLVNGRTGLKHQFLTIASLLTEKYLYLFLWQ